MMMVQVHVKFAKQLISLGLHVYFDDDILQLTARLQKMEFVRVGGFGEVFVGNFGQQKVALKKVKGVCVASYIYICCIYTLL